MIDKEKNIIEIENLKCVYPSSKKTALKIPRLNVLRNKITFVLGISGSGKSTLLETLGLMTNIFDNNSKIMIQPSLTNPQERSFNYKNIWANEKSISKFRDQYFSFIFQKIHLMKNFTNVENIILFSIAQGESKAVATEKAVKIAEDIGLNGIFDWNDYPNHLSGGQKERIAFVRAIITKYSLILCDEPTGNLDEITATKLLKTLKDEVINNKKTALIVSHNLKFALDYADQIIVLNKEGTIGENNIFNKTDSLGPNRWNEISATNPFDRLVHLLGNNL